MSNLSTLEANKSLVRRHFADVLHDPAVCDAIYASTSRFTPQTMKAAVERLKIVWSTACYMTVDDILAEDDRVMVRWTFTAHSRASLPVSPPPIAKSAIQGSTSFALRMAKLSKSGICLTICRYGSNWASYPKSRMPSQRQKSR